MNYRQTYSMHSVLSQFGHDYSEKEAVSVSHVFRFSGQRKLLEHALRVLPSAINYLKIYPPIKGLPAFY